MRKIYVFKVSDLELCAQASIDLNQRIVDIAQDYAEVVVTVEPKLISDKQRRALFLWFTKSADALNKNNSAWHNEAGRKGKWSKDRFHVMFKRFIKHYKDINSTKDQGTKGMNECMEAITAHIATEYNCTLPPFPSLENMSMAEWLKSN